MRYVASLKYGVIFKKAFCDPEIFSAFAQDIIGLPIAIEALAGGVACDIGLSAPST